jgi:hypothetical protein
MRFTLLIVATIVLSGCAAKYDQVNMSTPEAKFSIDGPVIIAIPANGFYETTEYRSSGRMTAIAVRSAFAKYSIKTKVANDCETLECLKEKYPNDFRYYVVPEILHWEERATEWSGLPDRIEVQLSVYEQGTWKDIAATHITGKSKWATFGGDHPQDLLPKPLNDYVSSLY